MVSARQPRPAAAPLGTSGDMVISIKKRAPVEYGALMTHGGKTADCREYLSVTVTSSLMGAQSTSPRHEVFVSIQALRGIAALLVVAFHYNEGIAYANSHGQPGLTWFSSYGQLSIIGAIGVPIFFVISGFVMGLQPPSQGWQGVYNFSIRRVIRIVPLYWIATFFVVFTRGADLPRIIQSLFFVAHRPGQNPLDGPGWTLEYEMIFYLAFALIVASGLFGSKAKGLIALGCILLVAVGLNQLDVSAFTKIGNPIVLEFCGGLVISYVHRNREVTALWPLYLTLGAAFLVGSATPTIHPYALIQAFWAASGFFIVLGLVSAETRGFAIGKWTVLQHLGAASYAIYLVHVPLELTTFGWIFWKPKLDSHLNPNLTLVLLVAYAVLIGVALHLLIERPLHAVLLRAARPKYRSHPEGAPIEKPSAAG